uniref:NADH dehydrogenase subunit 6 n=1 Tax=Hoplopleura akanezumi TaxID=1511645 RepID=A0A075EC78_9NEOP|nr:NADH dehydrogenase subunit 6 [Hoplopleura akanezumi]
MASVKLFIVTLLFWEMTEAEFGPIILLILYLTISGCEIYFMLSELGGLMFLLGLLGGLAVLMAFIIKMCSPSKVLFSLPSFPTLTWAAAISGVMGLFVVPSSNLSRTELSASNLFSNEDIGIYSLGEFNIIIILITLLMIMLLVVEAILCQKQKGFL